MSHGRLMRLAAAAGVICTLSVSVYGQGPGGRPPMGGGGMMGGGMMAGGMGGGMGQCGGGGSGSAGLGMMQGGAGMSSLQSSLQTSSAVNPLMMQQLRMAAAANAASRAAPPADASNDLSLVNPVTTFKNLDKNRDGVLTEAEIPKRLRARLMKADFNLDHKISRTELERASGK